MICSKMVKHFLLQMASLQAQPYNNFPSIVSVRVGSQLLRSFPETAKALIHLVRSIGEWKAGSVTWMLVDVAVHGDWVLCVFFGGALQGTGRTENTWQFPAWYHKKDQQLEGGASILIISNTGDTIWACGDYLIIAKPTRVEILTGHLPKVSFQAHKLSWITSHKFIQILQPALFPPSFPPWLVGVSALVTCNVPFAEVATAEEFVPQIHYLQKLHHHGPCYHVEHHKAKRWFDGRRHWKY